MNKDILDSLKLFIPWLITAFSIVVTYYTTKNATKISELSNLRSIEAQRTENWLKDFKEIISRIITILYRTDRRSRIDISININDLQKQIDQQNEEKDELRFLYNQLMLNLDLKDSLSIELLEPLKELNKKNDLDNRSNYSGQILASAIKIIEAKQNKLKSI